MRLAVSVSLDEKSLAEIDSARKELNLSRSAFLKFCVAQYLKGQKVMDSFNDMVAIAREQKLKELTID